MKIIGEVFGETMNSTRTYELAEFNMFVAVILRDEVIDFLNSTLRYHQAGLYYLMGSLPYHSRRKVYIGQTADVDKRLRQHIDGKEFWEFAVVFIRNTEQLNKSQVQYLEHVAIKDAIEYGSVELLENCQIPKEVYLSESDKKVMNDFYNKVRFMIQYAGFDVYTDYKMCEIDTGMSNHNVMSRMVNHYQNQHRPVIKKYTIEDDEQCGMVCEDNLYDYYEDDSEDYAISYELKPMNKECSASAIRMNDGRIMIMPFGYVSKNVDLEKISELVDVDKSIDRNSRYIKKDMYVSSLEDAALVVIGKKDKSLWKKIKFDIDYE